MDTLVIDDPEVEEPQVHSDGTASAEADKSAGKWRGTGSTVRWGLVAALSVAMVVAGLAGWLGFRDYRIQQAQHERAAFLQTGRQAALNLTTIDWEHADADVQRIIGSATGAFYDDFSARAQPFIDVVKQVNSKSEGTVTEAALENVQGDHANVLAAVSVNTTTPNTPGPEQRSWRMRVTVQKTGDEMKVSNVQFVP